MPIDFNKIKDSVQNGTEVVMQKSQDFIEVSSLKLRISGVEKKIQDLYNQIGEAYYKQYKNDKFNHNDLIKICKEINELNEDIKYLKNKIDKIKKE